MPSDLSEDANCSSLVSNPSSTSSIVFTVDNVLQATESSASSINLLVKQSHTPSLSVKSITSPKASNRRPLPSPVSRSVTKFSSPSTYKRARTVSPIIDDCSSDIDQEYCSQPNSELGDYDSNDQTPLSNPSLPTPLRQSYSANDFFHTSMSHSSQDKAVDLLMTDKSLSLNDQSAASYVAPLPLLDDASASNMAAESLPSYSDAMGQTVTDSLLPSPRPSGQEQIKTIRPMKNLPLVVGQTWYLASRDWYKRWNTACTQQSENLDQDHAIVVGPIDNQSLLDPDSSSSNPRLKTQITEGIHYEMLPEQGWNLLVSWYGVQGPTFARKVISGINVGQESVEFYPPTFELLRLAQEGTLRSLAIPPFSMSVSEPFSNLKAEAKRLLSLGDIPDTHIRFWHVPQPTMEESQKCILHISRLEDEEIEVIEAREKNLVFYRPSISLKELGLDEIEMVLAVEVKGQDRWPSDPAPAASILPSTNANLFAQNNGDFFDNLQQRNRFEPTSQTTPGSNSSADEQSQFNTNSQAAFASSSSSLTDGRLTRSQTAIDRTMGRSRGLRGLNNLGNTCFMNSALQCMSNTYELQQYFVSGVYRQELNTDNPLGMGGAIAEAFGNLIRNLWNGQGGSFWPREFKHTLSRFAPQFSGYAQHDSQELLAFLLDGLHEDLNRILKKPYIEAPDWEGGGEREMVSFARKQWDIYKARNDSVIVDLFQGQYRSTLICPECSKVSIKFDPFMYLTLPIPNKKKWRCNVYFVPFDSSKMIVKFDVQLPAGSNVGKLRQKVASHFGIDTKKILCGEIWHHRVFKWLQDYEPIIDIKAQDYIYFWELPVDYNPPKLSHQSTYRYHRTVAEAEEDLEIHSAEENVILPVFTSVSTGAEGSSSKPFVSRKNRDEAYGVPFFISVPREQMNDVESIQRIITDQYRRFSQNPQELVDGVLSYQQSCANTPVEAALTDWEMVGDSPSNSEAQIEIVGAVQQPLDNGVTEIRQDGEAVVFPDSQPTIQLTSDIDATLLVEKADTVSKNAQGKRPAFRAPFVVKFTVSDGGPGQGLPKGGNDSSEHMAEELSERKARLDLASNRKTAAATEIRTAVEAVDDSSDQPRFVHSQPDTSDSISGGGKEAASGSNALPLVYTGGAIICSWSHAAHKEYLVEAENGQVWGQLQDEVDAEITQEAGNSGSTKPKSLSMEDCMDDFTKEEKLGEDDPWFCPSCKDFRQATKKFDLWKVPDILVVHLKRFSAGRHSRDKLNMYVDFPLEGLDLTARVEGPRALHRLQTEAEANGEMLSESVLGSGILCPENDHDDAVASDQPIYDLYAVDNHFGGLGGGHYTAYAKNPADGKWYEYDDSSVRPVANPETVKSSSAYLLFYRRRTTRPIGGKSRQKFQEAVKEQAAVQQSTQEEDDRNSTPESHHDHHHTVDDFIGPFANTQATLTSDPNHWEARTNEHMETGGDGQTWSSLTNSASWPARPFSPTVGDTTVRPSTPLPDQDHDPEQNGLESETQDDASSIGEAEHGSSENGSP